MIDRQAQLAKQAGESQEAHRAFLLWLMQAPGRRSLRASARALKYSETHVRGWKKIFHWDERMQAIGAGADTLAARAYVAAYHRLHASREVEVVRPYMVVQYVLPEGPAPGLAPPPPLEGEARAIDIHREIEADEAAARSQKRTRTILDAAEARLAQQLMDNRKLYKVSIQDLLVIHRIRRELGGAQGAGGTGNPLATSVRVEKAAENGGDVLGALAEDHAEMGLILATLREHVDHSNVLPFPGGRQLAATGTDDAGQG